MNKGENFTVNGSEALSIFFDADVIATACLSRKRFYESAPRSLIHVAAVGLVRGVTR